eukprot:5710316-Pleurochrysis_carterae.AAC.1
MRMYLGYRLVAGSVGIHRCIKRFLSPCRRMPLSHAWLDSACTGPPARNARSDLRRGDPGLIFCARLRTVLVSHS